MKDWTVSDFTNLFSNKTFKLGEDGDGNKVEILMENFKTYMNYNEDENPLYIFENDLTMESTEGKCIREYYDIPSHFKEDILQVLENQRP